MSRDALISFTMDKSTPPMVSPSGGKVLANWPL